MICSPFSIHMKNVVHLSGCVKRLMSNRVCYLSQLPSSSFSFYLSNGYYKPKNTDTSVPKANCYSSVTGLQASRGSYSGSCFFRQRKDWDSLTVKNVVNSKQPLKACLDSSLEIQKTNVTFLVPKLGMVPKVKRDVGIVSWLQGYAYTGLIFGLLICYSTSEPVHAEAAQSMGNKKDSSGSFSHGKKVCTDYSVIGIPGDGRCLFRSIAHGACVRSGKQAPNESLQRELADELRSSVANEFARRRKETEWFIEGDFDTYVSQIRKPHVWGGEPEILMASHVLQTPITVYMHDEDSGGLIAIAEYGQEYGKENPINVLYHGFGHYDALQIPGKKGPQSRL
ncbi:hypothetical protein NMG60_11003729 [Bertholletia excelsa]